MKDRVTVTPKILELNDSNDIYMTLQTRVLSAEPNANKAEFTEDFILNTVNNKDDIIGIPFVVDKDSLEKGEYKNLGHKLNNKGELLTDQIGSFVDFWVDKDENDVMFLGGSIRIMKRFEKTCGAIKELFSSGNLATSCEVLVQDYEEISQEGIRKIHYNDGKNKLFASAIVTNPADDKARPTLLVAEAYAEDIQDECKGGEDLKKPYNNGIKVDYYGKVETSSLKFYEIEQDIYNSINPVDVDNGGRDYNYWIHTLYHDKVILEDNRDGKMCSANYKVENNTVVLDKKEDWASGSFQFVPDDTSVEELMEQNTKKVKELKAELNELKEEKATMAKEKELTVEELNQKIEVLETEIADLKEKNEGLESTIVSQKEELVKAEETQNELNEKVEELAPYKEQVEKAELDAKITALTDKYSSLLDEETFQSEEVAEAIQALDEATLNSIVVAEVARKAAEDVELASKEEKKVVVNASKPEGMPKVKDAGYWASKK